MLKTKVRRRGPAIGSMRHKITLHTRDIQAPAYGSVDFGEKFTPIEAWAQIITPRGKSIFDEVGDEVAITHEFKVRYDSAITSQKFLQTSDGRRYRVLDVENFDEDRIYMRLITTDRGLNEAAKA